MNQFIRSIAVLLLSACVMQGVRAQFNVSGPGFLPDENGTNLDAPQSGRTFPNLAVGTVVKDCAECPEMVVIPAGIFVMGSERNADEQPPHTVAIRSFLMGRTEVTQKQWSDIMGSNPSRLKDCGSDCPVESVSGNDVHGFLTKLNQKTGQKYRLPSEAEWEYAARAGTTTEWSFGKDFFLKLDSYAWHSGNSGSRAQAVAQKAPNAFGLFDMYGNVWEWVQDCWHQDYIGAPSDGSAWTTGCPDLVLRGGSRSDGPDNLRSASRGKSNRGDRYYLIGFRLARDL